MDLELTGKRALVTGASRGIGRAIALALAREGCDVVISARGEAALVEAATAIGAETGRRVVPVVADTSQAEDVARMVERTIETLGGVDILVNNAAEVGARGAADTLLGGDDALLQADLDTKVLGYVRACRGAARAMVRQGWGRIVLISGLATRTVTGVGGGLRNAAVTNLGAVLANELGPHGITVNTIQPGAIETETFDERLRTMAAQQGVPVEKLRLQVARSNAIQRIVTAEEVARVVTFLASPLCGAVTGESIAVSGGSRAIHY